MNKHNNHETDEVKKRGFGLVNVLITVIAVVILITAGFYFLSDGDQDSEQNGEATASQNDEEIISAENDFEKNDNIMRNDTDLVMVAIIDFTDDNLRPPSTNIDYEVLENDYFSEIGEHPVTGLPYTINQEKSETHHYIVYANGVCNEEGFIEATDDPTKVAISNELDSGQLYCVEN